MTSQIEKKMLSNLLSSSQFDLLGLSNKTINKVLSYLPVKDRMRARLNKRLSKIEAESKCYLKKVELKQIVIVYTYYNNFFKFPNWLLLQSFSEHSTCVNIKNRWYPFDFLKRIARNTSIGRLEIDVYEIFCVQEESPFFSFIRMVSFINSVISPRSSEVSRLYM